MLGMLDDKKKIAALIVGGADSDEDPKMEALKSAAEEFKAGLKLEDPMAIIEPLKALIELCSGEGEEEEPEEESEY